MARFTFRPPNKDRSVRATPLLYLAVWQLAYLILLHATGALQLDSAWESLVTVGAGIFEFALQFVCITALLGQYPRARVLVLGIWLFLQTALVSYLLETKGSLDYAVVIDNILEAFTAQSAELIYDILLSVNGTLLLGLLFLFFASLWRFERSTVLPTRFQLAGCCAVLLGVPMCVPHGTTDELTTFAHGAVRYHMDGNKYDAEYPPNTYPLIIEDGPFVVSDSPPHIFLIAVESFNSRVVQSKTVSGKPITPVFNSLMKDSIVIERFYANSIQTSKGHFSILFGLPPRVRGKALRNAHNIRYQGLPRILAKAGYRTQYVQSFHDLSFDNTERAMTHAGFADVRTIHSRLKPEDEAFHWGWGPEDHVLYRRSFELIDEARAAGDHRPVFMMLATIQNHMRFKIPFSKRRLHAEPKTHRERYENSVHLSDESLQVFFDELKRRPEMYENSVVIITGDHSFPLGGHGMEHNELGYWDESFRTPLLIWTGGKLGARLDTERVASQIDLPPTVLELAGVRGGSHHFMGHSVLAPSDPDHTAWIVQPYNGTWVGAVSGRYKYLKRERTGEEKLYDLISDPDETKNLSASIEPDVLQELRQKSEVPYRIQYLIDHNLVWDAR